MGQNRTFERVAENYLYALLKSVRDKREVAREMESAAAYLNDEGQGELAQALREVILKRLRPEPPPTNDRAAL